MLFFFLLLLFFVVLPWTPVSCSMPSGQSREGWTGGEKGAGLGVAPLQALLVQQQHHALLGPEAIGTRAPHTAENTPGLSQEGGKHWACRSSLTAVGKTGRILYLSVLTAAWLEQSCAERYLTPARASACVCACRHTHLLSCTHLDLIETTGGAYCTLLMFFTLVNIALLGRCSCAPTRSTQWRCGPGTLPSSSDPGPAKSCWSCFAFKLILLDCNTLPRKGSGCPRESVTDITFFSVRCHSLPMLRQPPLPQMQRGKFWAACLPLKRCSAELETRYTLRSAEVH